MRFSRVFWAVKDFYRADSASHVPMREKRNTTNPAGRLSNLCAILEIDIHDSSMKYFSLYFGHIAGLMNVVVDLMKITTYQSSKHVPVYHNLIDTDMSNAIYNETNVY